MKKGLIIIIAIVVILGIYSVSTYNSLVGLNVTADTEWKQVETQYQRRFDLIPNLVESVKGSMKQEQTIFTAIADARTKYSGAKTPDEKAAAAGQVESALSRLLVISENYPNLKSSDTVQALMSQLEGTENRINVQRMRYNDVVKSYNLKVMRFPSSIIASMFGFQNREYFEAEKGSEKAPEVKF
jgi:LemA protein